MTKAFWMFATNAGDGTDGNPNRPALPAVGGAWTSPGDIIRMTGPVAAPHVHLLVGGVALPDDSVGDGHRHYVVRINDVWQQVTVGAVNHTHTLHENAAGGLNPDYFMLFWEGSNADAVTIAADPNCFPIVEADVSTRDLDNTQWDAGELATWEARMLNVLGIQLPSQVDRGKRLVLLFLGALLSRTTDNERGYRF